VDTEEPIKHDNMHLIDGYWLACSIHSIYAHPMTCSMPQHTFAIMIQKACCILNRMVSCLLLLPLQKH